MFFNQAWPTQLFCYTFRLYICNMEEKIVETQYSLEVFSSVKYFDKSVSEVRSEKIRNAEVGFSATCALAFAQVLLVSAASSYNLQLPPLNKTWTANNTKVSLKLAWSKRVLKQSNCASNHQIKVHSCEKVRREPS